MNGSYKGIEHDCETCPYKAPNNCILCKQFYIKGHYKKVFPNMTVKIGGRLISDKGGEDMECGGKITDGVCDCHTHNCCPAVDGRSKINPECPHLEWVGEYKIFYARVMGKNTLEDCNI